MEILLILLPLMIGSITDGHEDARNRVDTWDLKRVCGTNAVWTPEDQKRVLAELKMLPPDSLINTRLKTDWARMRIGNRNCAGERVPTK